MAADKNPSSSSSSSLLPMLLLLLASSVAILYLVKTSEHGSGVLGTVKEMAIDGTLLPVGGALAMRRAHKAAVAASLALMDAQRRLLGKVYVDMELVPLDETMVDGESAGIEEEADVDEQGDEGEKGTRQMLRQASPAVGVVEVVQQVEAGGEEDEQEVC